MVRDCEEKIAASVRFLLICGLTRKSNTHEVLYPKAGRSLQLQCLHRMKNEVQLEL